VPRRPGQPVGIAFGFAVGLRLSDAGSLPAGFAAAGIAALSQRIPAPGRARRAWWAYAFRMAIVAVIGMGEMGSAVARALGVGGLRVVTTVSGRSERSARRAAEAGIEVLPSMTDVVRGADVLLSIVPPSVAGHVARSVAGALSGDRRRPLYADCNAVSPETAVEVERIVKGAGARFVDAGIIGGPPAPGGRGPVFYASGEAAGDLVELIGGPLDVRDIGGPAGRASALKMCYAAFTKGTTALATELLVASRRLGVADELRAELASSVPGHLQIAQRSIPQMPPKAYRWVGEMEEIASTFASVGLTPLMLQGAAEIYRLVERSGADGSELEAVISRLAEA
jgi:3-hydroxyisobutyrate dehydrogenase-like beta-hydroxyacid dehydrogenase